MGHLICEILATRPKAAQDPSVLSLVGNRAIDRQGGPNIDLVHH